MLEDDHRTMSVGGRGSTFEPGAQAAYHAHSAKVNAAIIEGFKAADDANIEVKTLSPKLQQSPACVGNDFARSIEVLFPDGSVGRHVWDDIISNVKSAAANFADGKSTRGGFRYSVASLRTMLGINRGIQGPVWEKLRVLFFQPTDRTLRGYMGSPFERGAMVDSINFLAEAIARYAKEPTSWHESDDGLSEQEVLAMNREIVVSCDAMEVREGVGVNVTQEKLVGLDASDANFDVIQNEFLRSVARAAEEHSETLVGKLELANKYEVFYGTSLGNSSASFPIAQYCLAAVNGTSLWHMLNDIVPVLKAHRLKVSALCADGASDNRGLGSILREELDEGMQPVGSHTARDFLPCEIAAELEESGIDVDQVVAVTHWSDPSLPVFWIPDPPHTWKRFSNAMDDSDPFNTTSKRDLRRPVDRTKEGQGWVLEPVQLQMLRAAKAERYNGVGFDPYQRITSQLWNKNNFARMRVWLAVRGFGAQAFELLKASEDDHVKSMRGSYMELCRIMNGMVDVQNGRRGKCNYLSEAQSLVVDGQFRCGPVTAENKGVTLRPLQNAAQFFASWKRDLRRDELGLDLQQQAAHFFPSESWADAQAGTIGLMSVCYYLLDRHPRMSLFLRKFQSDVVEHHFSHLRGRRGGSHRNPFPGAATADTQSASVHRQGTGGVKGRQFKQWSKRNVQELDGMAQLQQQSSAVIVPLQPRVERIGGYSTFCN
jgi:hypothetical protein